MPLLPINPKEKKEGELDILTKAKAAYEEIMIDSSKYYERFMEGGFWEIFSI